MPETELMLDAEPSSANLRLGSRPRETLYWIDVKAPALHRLGADGSQAQWRLEADIGAFALLEGAKGALVALRNGIFRLDFATGETKRLAPPPFDPDLFRFNEGVCDAEGRFWVGVMFDPRPGVTADRPPRPFIDSLSARGWSPAMTGRTCITASPGAPERMPSSSRIPTHAKCFAPPTTGRAASLESQICSLKFKPKGMCPTARRWTRKAATGARSTAAGFSIATIRRAA